LKSAKSPVIVGHPEFLLICSVRGTAVFDYATIVADTHYSCKDITMTVETFEQPEQDRTIKLAKKRITGAEL